MAQPNQEIEYGVKIKNAQKAIDLLRSKTFGQKIIRIKRDIYKKKNGQYFIKISQEKSGLKRYCVFSVKEDLLAQGVGSGMKVAEEIDIVVYERQLKDLARMTEMLGFKLVSSFEKVRHEFKIQDLTVTVDEYPEGAYLEVEGISKNKVMDFVKTLPTEITVEAKST